MEMSLFVQITNASFLEDFTMVLKDLGLLLILLVQNLKLM